MRFVDQFFLPWLAGVCCGRFAAVSLELSERGAEMKRQGESRRRMRIERCVVESNLLPMLAVLLCEVEMSCCVVAEISGLVRLQF